MYKKGRENSEHYAFTHLMSVIMATKRKLVSKSIHEKHQALVEVENGGKKSDIALKYGVPLNTLSTWIKNSEKIKTSFKCSDQNLSRKRIKVVKYEEIDNALLRWFTGKTEEGAAINGPILMEKANKFAKELGYDEFQCSVNWITTFKERHRIKFRSVQGEERAVDMETVEQWHQTIWPNILEIYEPRNIFNCDESGLFYKLLPNKTLAFKGQRCAGGKLSKDRLTLMFCVNMDGSDKCPLLTIGKSQKPRSFKNKVTLPTEYKSNRKAWMTSDIFTEWLKKFDRKMTTQKRKVALLLDNCAAHPKNVTGLKSVELYYLPPNTTSVLQPLDQGIIKNFKHFYRSSINRKHVNALDTGTEFKVSVLDAMTEAQLAWEKVTPETISNCWLHMVFSEKIGSNVDIEESTLPGLTNQECKDYITSDDLVLTSEIPSDKDIIDEIRDNKVESDDSDDESEESPPPSLAEAEAACALLRRLLMSNQDTSPELDKLCAVENFVSKLKSRLKKQISIARFFKK